MEDLSQYTDEELQKVVASGGTWRREEPQQAAAEPMLNSQGEDDLSQYTDEELQRVVDSGGTWRRPAPSAAPAASVSATPVSTKEQAIARARQQGEGETGFWGTVGEAALEGLKGGARAAKAVGQGVLGTATGVVRLAGTPVRMATGWDGIHRLADKIDQSYANFGSDALESDYGESPDHWGYSVGRAGEKIAGTAGSLLGIGGPGLIAKAGKLPGAVRATGAAVQKALPFMFGNDAAVRAYDTARGNRRSKGEAAALAGLNGAIHFIGFKLFENKSLNKMLGMPQEMEAMMPKWAGEAAAAAPQGFNSLARSVRNGMIKYTLAERGKGMLKAGGIMGVQNLLSDPVMQVAEGKSLDGIDFSRTLGAGLEGLEEGALMEGLLGGAAILKSPWAAREFIADKLYRGKDYKVIGSDGKPHNEPGLLETPQGRMFIMKQNPAATERVLDIVDHDGKPTKAELDAAFLPPDMSAEELKKFHDDWYNDLSVEERRGGDEGILGDHEETEMAQGPSRTDVDLAGVRARAREIREEERDERQAGQRIEQQAEQMQRAAQEQQAAKEEQDAYDQAMAEHEEGRHLAGKPEPAKTTIEIPDEALKQGAAPEEGKTPTQEKPNETGNGADEAPAKPEQGTAGEPEAGEAARPVEAEPPRAEAPREGVVEPPAAAEPPKTPQEPSAEAGQGEATPTAEKPPEAVSEAPKAEPVPERPAPTNRLRRADGTDPLVEKEEQAKKGAETTAPLSRTVRKNLVKRLSPILDLVRNKDGSYNPDALRNHDGNGGLNLKDLKRLHEHPEVIDDLGLKPEAAAALRSTVRKAYEDGYLEYHYQSAHDKLAAYERGSGDLAFVYNAVADAAGKAKAKGDKLGESLLQPKLAELVEKVNALSEAERNMILSKAASAVNKLTPMEKKGRASITTVEGKDIDIPTGGIGGIDGDIETQRELDKAVDRQVRSESSDAARLGRITERDDAAEGGAEKPQGVSRDGNKAGDRHIQLETKGGKKYVVWRNEFDEVVKRAPMDALRALAKASPEMKALVDKLEAGEEIRASKAAPESPEERDLRFASDENYQKWLKSRKANDAEPLRERYEQEQAKAAKSIARNTLPGVDVEIVDRAFNPETDGGVGKRKSIGGIFTGTAADYANRSREGGKDDGPSLKSIGTGEGAQAFGWGLYGSNRRGVAKSYARAGKNKLTRLEFDGKEWDENAGDWGVNSIMSSYLYANDPAFRNNGGDFATRLRRQAEIYRQRIDDIERNGKSDPEYMFLEKLRRAEKMLSEAANDPKHTLDRIKEISPTANVYGQTFFTDRAPGDESHLLKWYEPVSDENLARVAEQKKKEGLKEPLDLELWQGVSNPIGERFYNHIVRMTGSPKSASEFLARAGIDGVKYPVGSYGGKGVKSGDEVGWNYVSFRDDNIRVDHKWTDDQMRYLRDGEGRVVGTFDRSTNKVKLYRGASAATLVHELGGHATLRFAEQEAERGNRQLLDRINRAIDEAPQALKDEIRSRYPGADETALRDEIWAALRERNSPAMEKAIRTLQGKAWYNRAWSAFKDAWKGLLARMGFNRADLSQIDKMSNDEFLSHLDRLMSDGKTLGRLERGNGEGQRAMFTTREQKDYPPTKIQTPEGVHFDTITSRDVAETSSSGVAARSIAKPEGESQGGEEKIRKSVTSAPAKGNPIDDVRPKGERLQEGAQDSDISIRNLQRDLGGVEDKQTESGHTDAKTTFNEDGTVKELGSTDVYSAKMRMNGHLQAGFNEIKSGQNTIDKTLADNGLTQAQFDKFLYASHAPERNQTVAERMAENANKAEWRKARAEAEKGNTAPLEALRRAVKVDTASKEYSGMSTDDANAYLASPEVASKRAALESAANELYKMERKNLDRLLESGRISKEFYDLLTTRWQKYVPLRTDVEGKDGAAYNLSVGGFRQNEFLTAEGRKTEADSPYTFAMLQVQQGLRGSEVNTVNLTAANLVRKAEQQGYHIGDIIEGKESGRGKGWTFLFADGDKVEVGGDMKLAKNRNDIILFKENGELKAIRMVKGANGRGEAVADAISGRNVRQWTKDLTLIPRFTRWLSAMRTQFSPEFIFSNALADHMESTQALIGRYGIKDGGKLAGQAIAWEVRNRKDLRQYIKTGNAGNGYVKEAIDAGVLIKGGVAAHGYAGELKDIQSSYDKFVRDAKGFGNMTAKEKAKFVWDGLENFISHTNEFIENSTRIGIYSALREHGVSKADAVKFAREATVDFNRKGIYTPWVNGLFMFSNASIQGALRSVQAMTDANGKSLVGLLIGAGIAKAGLDYILGNDDEREKAGGRNARNLSEYDKKHKLGIPIPGTSYQVTALRMRGPYAAIPYLAQTFTNVALGEAKESDAAKTVIRELTDQATDLLGGNGIMNGKGELDSSLILQSFAPTLADPIVQWATGKDYKGDERKARAFDKTMPLSSNGKRNTPVPYKLLAQGINAIPGLSGGNENRKGRLDIAPEDLQLIVEFLAGGVGRDLGNVVSTVQNAKEIVTGGSPERTLSQTPLARTLVNEYPENTSRYFDALDAYERDKAEFKKTTDIERRREMKKEKPYLFTGKSLLDGQIDKVKELTHLERGEVKSGNKWVEPKTPRSEAQKEKYRELRLKLQATILRQLKA